MSAARITIIPGDGIGPEIMAVALACLRATGVAFEVEEALAGQAAQKATGHPLPPETVASIQRNRIALKGPLLVDPESPPVELESGEIFATPNAALRGVCRAFANVRPCRLFAGVRSRYEGEAVDFIIVREVSEGVYIAQERLLGPDRAEAVAVTTRQASERIARFAFELAARQGRKTVTAVHKANVLDKTDGLFLRSVRAVSKDFPALEARDMMIDASAAKMVLDPASFDVIVAPNQYGDILSDLGAAVIGGLGLGPGANFGREMALFEACHGAAPDIAEEGVANPIALVLSGAMLLEHVGEARAAKRVRAAVAGLLRDGAVRTPDLGGAGSTDDVAAELVRRIEESRP